jgi:hypothetical protein
MTLTEPRHQFYPCLATAEGTNPLGVTKFYQDSKTSQGTSRAGLESFQAFIWYKVINFTLPITGTDQF